MSRLRDRPLNLEQGTGAALGLEVNPPHHLLQRHRFGRELWLLALGLVALGGVGVGEHAEAGVHDDLGHARHGGVQHLAEDAQAGGDAHRFVDTGLGDHVGGFFG